MTEGNDGAQGSGNSAAPPGVSESGYINGVGVGTSSTNNGGNGLVVVEYNGAM